MNGLDDEIWDREYPTEEEVESNLNGYSEGEELYEEQDEEFFEEFAEDYDESEIDDWFEGQEQSVMDRATIRLEQGKLYNMLIQHSLFEGVEADPQAISNVESEIRGFIMERLEILLGMRAEKETEVQQIIQPSQFNDMEVQALKMMASKVTKGASASAPTSQPEVSSELNTIKKIKAEPKINALGGKSKQKPVAKKQIKKQASKPLRKTPKQNRRKKLKQEVAEVSSAHLSVDQAAKKDINYIESIKKMSLADANTVVSERHDSRPRSKAPISQDSVNAHYSNKMAMNETANTFTALLANAKKI